MAEPKKYAPVGCCIYCRSTIYAANKPHRRLGDEHIVPRGFGGIPLLPAASCEKHERATSKIEDHCVRHLLKGARPHIGVKGKKSHRVATHGPFSGGFDESERLIPVAHHPGYMIDYTYPPLNYVAKWDVPPTMEEQALIHIRPVVKDFQSRVVRLGGNANIRLGQKESLQLFARLLAKIAHVYAVAELGLEGYDWWLPRLISDDNSPFGPGDLMGSAISEEPPGTSMHEVGFATPAPDGAVIVRIRLFANLPTPPHAHYVVAGRPL